MHRIQDVVRDTAGHVLGMTFISDAGQERHIQFRSDEFVGPELFVRSGSEQNRIGPDTDIRGDINLSQQDDCAVLRVSIENTTDREIGFERVSLRLGLDTYMESFPQWRDTHFPTLLRCERTHFWGYAMSPNGSILGMASPDPIASWTVDYESIPVPSSDEKERAGITRVHSFTLDLLHAGPLPAHHPEVQGALAPHERRDWTVTMYAADGLNEVLETSARLCDAPMIQADSRSATTGERLQAHVIGEYRTVRAWGPDGSPVDIGMGKPGELTLVAKDPGQYRVIVESDAGKVSEAVFSALRPWSWYLQRARLEAVRFPQFASSHCEQWLGLHSAFLARRHFPDAGVDEKLAERFRTIYRTMWSEETGRPIAETFGRHVYRVFTNSAQMISLLCDAYEAGEGIEWLERAANLADFVQEWQVDEGYYSVPDVMDLEKSVIYTSVLYPAKSVLELCEIERELGETSAVWRERYERHYASAGRAIDHLARVLDNLNTEGPDSFEDGMISCSATQLAFYALTLDDSRERERFTNAAEHMMTAHACLEQQLVPDARMSFCTLRFWEAQYDVLARKSPNMMNSPHGWTAWSLYAAYYLYLLTGRVAWLTHLFNGIGACAQLIDPETGTLRWSFVCDPYMEVSLLEPDPENPGRGKRFETVIGETYLPMIADFHYPKTEPVLGNSPENGWSCGNDVHEIFKCMEETVLKTAFVHETEDGSFVGRNCTVQRTESGLTVKVSEPAVSRIHVNTITKVDVEATVGGITSRIDGWSGFDWFPRVRENKQHE